jgi:hypothetical protein
MRNRSPASPANNNANVRARPRSDRIESSGEGPGAGGAVDAGGVGGLTGGEADPDIGLAGPSVRLA